MQSKYNDFLTEIIATMKLLENPVNTQDVVSTCFTIDWEPKKIIFNNPVTVIYWTDGSKTTVKCHDEDKFDPEKGLCMALLKRLSGNTGEFNNVLNDWLKKAIYQGV